jgi:outer membrane protein insertion porin family
LKFNCFGTFLILVFVSALGLAPCAVFAQADLENRPIADIRVEGLKLVKLSLVMNQLRAAKGDPYDEKIVTADVKRLTRLDQFKTVVAKVVPKDGSLILTFVVEEEVLLTGVRVVGNKLFSDQEILGFPKDSGWQVGMVPLRTGDPAADFLIKRGKERIETAYQKAGFYKAKITIDAEGLEKRRMLTYHVLEGPLMKLSKIHFVDNTVFSDKELLGKINSKTEWWPIRKGLLSKDVLESDVATLRSYYRRRGYRDAEVGVRVETSVDDTYGEAYFLIKEGNIVTVGSIKIEGSKLFSDEQIKQAMALKIGGVYSEDKVRQSRADLQRLFYKLGHIDMRLVKVDGKPGLNTVPIPGTQQVAVTGRIIEARPHFVGKIEIRGNEKTKDRVVLRDIRGLMPGRRFDGTGVEKTRQRLSESSLFDVANVEVLGDSGDEYRDVLIDVQEKDRTGSLSFGAALSSDVGVLGAIDLVQRNFDWQDMPDDWNEFISGKAFVGAGQYFQLTLQPGNERSLYSVGFREPYMFDTSVFLQVDLRFFEREREDWDEQRAGGSFSIGQMFGDVWRAQITPRLESIHIDEIDPAAPMDAFAVAGGSSITGLGFSVIRDTTDNRLFPTRGNRWETGIERVGVLGGDYEFTSFSSDFKQFWTVDRDFFGTATVLVFKTKVGLIFEDGEAPLFERFYAGGHRTFRGFRNRGAGPRGIRMDTSMVGDDPVGGDFQFLMGAEYNMPIYGDTFRGVLFVDSGTVQEDVGLDAYRVSIGGGVRVKIPILGQAPFALDLAIPLIKEDGDEVQVISFDVALPF